MNTVTIPPYDIMYGRSASSCLSRNFPLPDLAIVQIPTVLTPGSARASRKAELACANQY
jgi:hypothetical protein